METNVGIVLFEDVEELDFVGPWEVFGMAARRQPELKPFTVSEKGGTVRCAKGMRVVADHSFADAPRIDLLLVPGGQGTRQEVGNRAMIDWIAAVAPGCRWVTSVCTGALLLVEAGAASGRQVTTHWGFVETLRARGDATVLDDVRFVRDGNVVTAAGVSAGIDMALWLVGQLYDPAFARHVQRWMEYDPAPPYTAAV